MTGLRDPIPEPNAEELKKHWVGVKKKSQSSDPSAGSHKQETLRLDETTRGLFERVERTVVNGEDLDRPTFSRRGIPIKVI